jgi:hypothetical protein
MSDLLNPYQRASLLVTLQDFEKSLRRAESLLDGAEVKGILFRQRFNISRSRQAQARKEIAIALDQIYKLSCLFAFNAEEQDPARLISGEMSVHWSNLLDSLSRKLKRYGKVHPQLAENLDHRILSLSNTASNLVILFEKNSS